MKRPKITFNRVLVAVALLFVVFFVVRYVRSTAERQALKKIIARLEADSRVAQVLVTDVRPDASSGKAMTTIKFLEYDADGKALSPRYFTFGGNIIQFQSLVVRFKDFYVEAADAMRGKSVYLFLKVFLLDGQQTQVFDLTAVEQVPEGYKIAPSDERMRRMEEIFWKKFWVYALDPAEAKKVGIKNAQIEAPGTKFIPGTLYTIKIEHDGGLRIDAEPLPAILKGERIEF
ncbi:MAG: hypothetical protein V1863_06685 [Candidatus Omnitrophota bacterium]